MKLKSPNMQPIQPSVQNENTRFTQKCSESDREEYCTKSNSEVNLRDSIHGELQKNQSLQNIHRRVKTSRVTADSDEDVNYRFTYKRHEPNGNYQDSDEDGDSPPRAPHATYASHTTHGAHSPQVPRPSHRPHSSHTSHTIRMENGFDSSDHDTNDNPLNHNKSDTDLHNLESVSLKNKPSKGGKGRKIKRKTVK